MLKFKCNQLKDIPAIDTFKLNNKHVSPLRLFGPKRFVILCTILLKLTFGTVKDLLLLGYFKKWNAELFILAIE